MSKVLIVEDDAHIRRLLRATLDRAGHAAVEAPDARTALAMLGAERPDVVLLDLGLPDRDGLELIQLVKRRSDATLIVVSAREDTAEKVAAYFAPLGPAKVERFEAANVLGLNFVLSDVLAGGASQSLRTDTQGKTLAVALLRMEVEVPADLARRG